VWSKIGLSFGFLIVALVASVFLSIPFLPPECQYGGGGDTYCSFRTSALARSFWLSSIAAFIPTFWVSKLSWLARLKIGTLCFLASQLLINVAGLIAGWGLLSGILPLPIVLVLRLLGFLEIWALSSWLSNRASRAEAAKKQIT
jgi:hypothetical protein